MTTLVPLDAPARLSASQLVPLAEDHLVILRRLIADREACGDDYPAAARAAQRVRAEIERYEAALGRLRSGEVEPDPGEATATTGLDPTA